MKRVNYYEILIVVSVFLLVFMLSDTYRYHTSVAKEPPLPKNEIGAREECPGAKEILEAQNFCLDLGGDPEILDDRGTLCKYIECEVDLAAGADISEVQKGVTSSALRVVKKINLFDLLKEWLFSSER